MDWYRRSQLVVEARDVPLNLRGWRQRWAKFFKWASSVLSSAKSGEAHSAMLDFERVVYNVFEEDRYRISQTEYGYMWEDPDSFFRAVDTYLDTLESVDFYLSDGDARKAIASMQYLPEYVERIRYYKMGFTQARSAAHLTLRDYVDEEDAPLTRGHLASLVRSSAVIAKWFGDFTHIERARRSVVENLETLVEWNRRQGPADRTAVDRLYHATVSAEEIETEGFRVNTGTRGLGGATDDMISTTLSKRVADAIADSLRRVIALANGAADCSSILRWARKAGVLDQMVEWGEGGMSGMGILVRTMRDVGEVEALKMVDAGYAPVFSYGMDAPGIDELSEDAIPIKVERMGRREVARSYWTKDRRKNDDLLLNVFRTYLGAMESSGKGYDPLFFSVDLENFRGLESGNVGVFEIRADMENPDIKYVEGMYEYRIPVESIESVKRVA